MMLSTVNEVTPSIEASQGLDIFSLLDIFWRGRLVIASVVAIALISAILYLNIARYTYTVEYQVTATEAGQNSLMGMLGGFGALAAGAGVKLGGEEPASPFGLYRESLQSLPSGMAIANDEQMMRKMFPSHWDAQRGVWRNPSGPLTGISEMVKSALGIPVNAWRKPGASDVQRFLKQNITVTEMPKKSLVLVRMDHEDPKFAVELLEKLHNISDDQIRLRTLDRTSAYISYLEKRLPEITVAEQRRALAEMLSNQEKQRVMASAGVPFAAEIFSPIMASPAPTFPKPLLTLVASVVVGFFIGCLLTFAIHLWRMRNGPIVEATIS